MLEERQSGRTSRQIQEAPLNAIFVCGSAAMRHYAVDLARHLGRGDLKVTSGQGFDRDNGRGLSAPMIIDHDAWEQLRFADCVALQKYIQRQIERKERRK